MIFFVNQLEKEQEHTFDKVSLRKNEYFSNISSQLGFGAINHISIISQCFRTMLDGPRSIVLDNCVIFRGFEGSHHNRGLVKKVLDQPFKNLEEQENHSTRDVGSVNNEPPKNVIHARNSCEYMRVMILPSTSIA